MYARMSKTMRTFVDLVIFPLALFRTVWPAHDISTVGELNALPYVPVYNGIT